MISQQDKIVLEVNNPKSLTAEESKAIRHYGQNGVLSEVILSIGKGTQYAIILGWRIEDEPSEKEFITVVYDGKVADCPLAL